MKNMITIGMVAVLMAGTASAQDVVMVGQGSGNNTSEARVSAEAALVTAHVWRGQVQNNDFVFQPQITVEQ